MDYGWVIAVLELENNTYIYNTYQQSMDWSKGKSGKYTGNHVFIFSIKYTGVL